MGPEPARSGDIHWTANGPAHGPLRRSAPVLDLVYTGLTIVVFAALWLLVKGVERVER